MRPQSTLAARLFPSMTDLAFVMPLVFLYAGMKGAHTLLSDGDTGWHLRTGQWILEHGRVPDRDLYSFTRAGQPWFAWEWLWDVAFGWLHLHFGMFAVVLATSVVLGLTFALLFRLARAQSGNSLVSLAVALAAAGASAGHWLARPHLFTMLFTVIFCMVLERPGRLLWILPPLMVLWTNLHGGFFVGILLILCYAACEARRPAPQLLRRYLLVASACSLATLMNPYGYRLHAHILSYLGDGFFRDNIMEFQSLDFQSGTARYFEILLLAGAGAAFERLRQGRLVWPLLFLIWGHLALYSARNVEIFVLLAAPPAAAWIAYGIRHRGSHGLRDFTEELTAFDAVPHWPVASVVAVVMLAALLHAPRTPPAFRAAYDPKSFPVAAASALEQAGLLTGVFTEDLWGGYLIFREYPRGRVFMDGRSDFYGADFARKYIAVMNVGSGWEESFRRYGVNTVLLPPDAPLAGALKQSGAWHLIYDDGVAVIFRATTHQG